MLPKDNLQVHSHEGNMLPVVLAEADAVEGIVVDT